MREALAERLLATVMQWTPEDVARERPLLKAMAAFKYDEYQQFAPGMRFIESLALWLYQFETKEERDCAYIFMKKKLIFFSNAEMTHFVSIAYPDHIRPILIKCIATTSNISDWKIHQLIQNPEFRLLHRRCLFLGLSDGARIDVFRRSNRELSHEQIWQTYEQSPEKATSAKKELEKDVCHILQKSKVRNDEYFRMIFLLDDFSGSGLSYLRKSSSDNKFAGKIHKFYEQLTGSGTGLSSLVNMDDLYVGVTLYVATERTKSYLETTLHDLFAGTKVKYGIQIVQQLADELKLQDLRDGSFLALTDKYYDSRAETESTEIGGTDVKRGFADCGLSVVLSHNTPNNSVFLLWADPSQYRYRGLFPRVERHRSKA